MAIPTNSRADLEKKKFRVIGSGADKIGVATQLFIETSAGLVLPVKGVNDGSNRGKIVVSIE